MLSTAIRVFSFGRFMLVFWSFFESCVMNKIQLLVTVIALTGLAGCSSFSERFSDNKDKVVASASKTGKKGQQNGRCCQWRADR